MPKKVRKFQKVERDWKLPEPAIFAIPVDEAAVEDGAEAMHEAWADTDDELSTPWAELDEGLKDVFRRQFRIGLSALIEARGARVEVLNA